MVCSLGRLCIGYLLKEAFSRIRTAQQCLDVSRLIDHVLSGHGIDTSLQTSQLFAQIVEIVSRNLFLGISQSLIGCGVCLVQRILLIGKFLGLCSCQNFVNSLGDSRVFSIVSLPQFVVFTIVDIFVKLVRGC